MGGALRSLLLLGAAAALSACGGSGGADAGRDAGSTLTMCRAPVENPPGLRCFSSLTFVLGVDNTQIDEACFACSESMCDAEARTALGEDGIAVTAPAGACADLIACAAECGCGDADCQESCRLRVACTEMNPLIRCLRDNCTASCLPNNDCGDGVLDATEDCEPDLPSGSCSQVGMGDGVLRCTRACRWDISGCLRECCGDGRVTRGEECDGVELMSLTCEALGFEGGVLGCDPFCRIDTSACTGDGGRCGDGVISPFLDEVCDEGASPFGSCEDVGYASGTIGCNADCSAHDFSTCVPRTPPPDGACGSPIVAPTTPEEDGYIHFFGTTAGGSTVEIGSCGSSEGPEAVYEIEFPPGTIGAILLLDPEGTPIPGAVLHLRESCDPASEVACARTDSDLLTVAVTEGRRYLLFIDGVEALPIFEVVLGTL